jgi:hypothetical protein
MSLPQYSSRGLWVNENRRTWAGGPMAAEMAAVSECANKKGRGGEDRGRRFPVKGNVREGGPGLG